jgi:hypothetical protein
VCEEISKETATKKHGVLLANSFISPAALVSLGTELAEGAKIAGKALDYYELRGGGVWLKEAVMRRLILFIFKSIAIISDSGFSDSTTGLLLSCTI